MAAFPNIVAPQLGTAFSHDDDDDAGPLAGIVEPLPARQAETVFMINAALATPAAGREDLTWQELRHQQHLAQQQQQSEYASVGALQAAQDAALGSSTPWSTTHHILQGVTLSEPSAGLTPQQRWSRHPSQDRSLGRLPSTRLQRQHHLDHRPTT